MIAALTGAVRARGVRRSAHDAVHLVITYRARRRWEALDREFDRRHGVETTGIVPLRRLRVRGPNGGLGVRYQPTSPDGFRALMRSVGPLAEELTFVDLGAGKGRAVLLASELPFRRIVGVEFAPDLVAVAGRNAERFGAAGRVELVCSDVAEYELPDEPLLLYNYNSFAEPVMRAVLANLRRSLERSPRRVVLALVNRRFPAEVVEDAGFRREQAHECGEVYAWEPAGA